MSVKDGLSIEVFPPKTTESREKLVSQVVPSLVKDGVKLCSVTYGAGGLGNRSLTIDLVDDIKQKSGIKTVMHITTNGATVEGMCDLLKASVNRGIKDFLALRGDGIGSKTPKLAYASDLVKLILKEVPGAKIGVAGFPDGNRIVSETIESCWTYLCKKIELGASFVLTQMFFSNESFYKMRDFVHQKLGRTVPIMPGIMPISGIGQIRRFIELTKSPIPKDLEDNLNRYQDDPEGLYSFGKDYATKQSQDLIDNGVSGLHFYCLNKVEPVKSIMHSLSI